MIGVLLLNLGGPGSLDSVKPFLINLFSDREIIKLPVPAFLQKTLAWLIASFRSKKVMGYYRLIGGKSPILDITRAQAEVLEKFLNANPPIPPLLKGGEGGGRYRVYFGMRYSPPLIKDVLKRIIEDRIKTLIVIPLFPHYSKATTGSAFKELKKDLDELGGVSELRITYIESWYDNPLYLNVLSETIKEGIQKSEVPEKVQVVFSAHSLPKSFIDEGDPYLKHLNATIAGLLERVGPVSWHLSFQSRSGPVKWLEPGTDYIIDKLAEEGHKEILMVPISFVSDHLETLYEIDILYRKRAEEKGVLLRRTESLNTSPKFIEALAGMVEKV